MMDIGNLCLETGRFQHVVQVKKRSYVANQLNDVTSFCALRLRQRDGMAQIKYELGMVVLESHNRAKFEETLQIQTYVILPQIPPTKYALETIVRDGRISDWLVGDIIEKLQKYSLTMQEFLDIVQLGEDPWIAKLQRVYKGKFDAWIMDALPRV